MPTVSTSTRNVPRATSTGTASTASARFSLHPTRMIWRRPFQMWNGNSMRPTTLPLSKARMSVTPRSGTQSATAPFENRYHPIRDYLNGLKWDGTERIAHVLYHFLGAAEDEYTCEAMKIFLLGAIKRVFQPGCKFETMLCLVGGQGCGSPVATSKCCRHFEAPTEPTGETRGSPPFFDCWRSRMSGSRMTCGGWTMTTCTASCKVTGSSKCRR